MVMQARVRLTSHLHQPMKGFKLQYDWLKRTPEEPCLHRGL